MAEDKQLDKELNAAPAVNVHDEPDLDPDPATETKVVEANKPTETKTVVETPAPPVIPPPLTHEIHEHEGRRWTSIAGYLVAALIVAAIIVFGARSIYHHYHKPSNPVTPAGNTNVPSQPETATNKSTSSKSQSSTSTNSSTPSTGVPNTGPGDTLALFAGVSLAAAGLHYIWSLRRQNTESKF